MEIKEADLVTARPLLGVVEVVVDMAEVAATVEAAVLEATGLVEVVVVDTAPGQNQGLTPPKDSAAVEEWVEHRWDMKIVVTVFLYLDYLQLLKRLTLPLFSEPLGSSRLIGKLESQKFGCTRIRQQGSQRENVL
jgi:hypothetical protein